MRAKHERVQEPGPTMPDNGGKTADEIAAVGEPTSDLIDTLVAVEESTNSQTITEEEPAGEPVALTPTEEERAGEPAASTPTLNLLPRDNEDTRTKTFAGILERNEQKETAAIAKRRYRTLDSLLADKTQSQMCMIHCNCCVMNLHTFARTGGHRRRRT